MTITPTEIRHGAAGTGSHRYLVPGLARGLALLEAFDGGRKSLSLADLCRAVELPRSSVYRLAYTLVALGFLIRNDETKTYRLGARVLGLGFTYLASQELVEVARPFLKALRDRTDCSAHLGILEGTEIVYLARYAVRRAVTSGIDIGSRLPAHASSMGRAILGAMPQDEVRRLYDGVVMSRVTDQTAICVDDLLALVAHDRIRGAALSVSAYEPGIASAAAAVFGAENSVIGAINVTTPVSALSGNELQTGIADAVIATAAEISAWLGAPGQKRSA